MSLYCRRGFFKVCCLACRYFDCCWMYTDPSFPPNEESLGNVGGDSANKSSGKTNADVTWLRAGQFSESGRMQLFEGTVDSRDICQGALGDCWLLAAMACLAEYDGAIHSLFKARERDPRGKYHIKLFDGAADRWELVTIDDWVPCNKTDYLKDGTCKTLFMQPHGNELWAVLLEKAFAKFCGSYANLEGGLTIWAVRAMTGDPAREFALEADKKNWVRSDLINVKDPENRRKCSMLMGQERIINDVMFQTLKKYSEIKSVCCASGASETCGLHSGHAYSILKVRQVKQFQLLQIRNPWATGEWKGDWSDKSDMWDKHPEVKKAVGFVDVDDGAFWMSWGDFVQNWSRIGIVDRTVDVNCLKLQVRDDSACAPVKGCAKGCLRFWCLCEGARRLYCPHRASQETVSVDSGWCSIM